MLHEYGYEALECASEQEALEKAEELENGSRQYPVYYSVSNTSGEKAYEEFYTEKESVDFHRLKALGVVTGKQIPDQERIQTFFAELEAAFAREETSKEEVVSMIGTYLPNFEHIETGRSLDSKM